MIKMIHYIYGIILLLAIFALIYFLRSKKTESSNDVNVVKSPVETDGPAKSDIVLAKITSINKDIPPEYGLLFNGTPGKEYTYMITENANTIAQSKITCPSSGVVKIKGIPIVENNANAYVVQVGGTVLDIVFSPPDFILPFVKFTQGEIDCNTSSTPTNMEVIEGGVKVPFSRCQVKIEPPGFVCQVDVSKGAILMIYNGENVVNIMNIDASSGEGETRI